MPKPALDIHLPPLASHLGFWLRYVSNHVSLRFEQLLEQQDITVTEWVALRTLWEQSATTHADLIQVLGMTKGTASKVMTRLEEKGLAARALAEGRSREQQLSLTDAGQVIVPQLATLADANEAHFFGHLPATERAALEHSLQALVRYHQFSIVPTT